MDPVYQDKETEKWFFWDETWADSVGPYDTEEECREDLRLYVIYLG